MRGVREEQMRVMTGVKLAKVKYTHSGGTSRNTDFGIKNEGQDYKTNTVCGGRGHLCEWGGEWRR
jgi:hypothetical protein